MTSAPADARTLLTGLLRDALARVVPAGSNAPILLDRPKLEQHGDFACNIALLLAKELRGNPRNIAQQLVAALPASPHVEKTEIAGAGFINLFLTNAYKQQVVSRVLAAGDRYGAGTYGQQRKTQVEFVSANPTGPLHVGHGRGAAFGASVVAILAMAGFHVSREYYVNDAGRQMDILALSTWLRYLESGGATLSFPPNAYQGDYVRAMAAQLRSTDDTRFDRVWTDVVAGAADVGSDPEKHLDDLIANAKRLLGKDYDRVHRHALETQLADCRNDLAEFGVTFDQWFSERSLFTSGRVEQAVRDLEQRGHIYLQDGARWFRSSDFGDEKDRVVQRENGQYTYFASDIAYHIDKFGRGYDRVIDVWGADHHGYIPRVKGALAAVGQDPDRLNVALVQFAVLYRNGQKVSMSTRSGEFVTLRELRQEVGNDAARFFYVLRKSDQHLDFDLDLAKSQSNDNPVYYIQYAHARVCSVLEQWGGDENSLRGIDTTPLVSPHETVLLKRLMEFPEIIENAARDLAPHSVAFYLKDLAGEFHSYYNAERFLVDDSALKAARLALALAVRQVLRNGLALLGVTAPEKM
ncbi:MAG: arginine--tRNA ligase [Betaproteobacteria bacterium]|nr:arginine--tRNA ligase [Betaproteobacteria bacterium]